MKRLVHYEKIAGQLRIFPAGVKPPAPYNGSGAVVWRQPLPGQPQNECEIRGLKAEMTRRHWRDMAALLRELGAERAWAVRGPGKLLPFAKPGPDGWQFIDLADILDNPPADGGVTGFVDLA